MFINSIFTADYAKMSGFLVVSMLFLVLSWNYSSQGA